MPKTQPKILAMFEGQEVMDRNEFIEAFKKVAELIVVARKQLNDITAELQRSFASLKEKLVSDNSAGQNKLLRIVDAEIESIQRRFSAEQKKIDDRLAILRDGIDADDAKILEELSAKLPKLQDIVNETIRQIPKQEEKVFGINDIEGLKNAIEELEDRIVKNKRVGGGGFSAIAMSSHIIDDETPSGTINGTNKAFTIGFHPVPEGSLKVYLNGARQRVTEDYTFSGVTITFTVAPPTGSVLLVDYRK